MRVLVTGGLGFIGRYVVRRLVGLGYEVRVIDALTYAAHSPATVSCHVDKADIVTLDHLPHGTEVVVNLAAETHVDNSIQDSTAFWRTNVLGTQRLLELVRGLPVHERPTFIQISTDEVYGQTLSGLATTNSSLRPSSPYAASKASADLAVQSYQTTYGLRAMILRMTNVYGEGQFREKLIPKAIDCLRREKPVPIHGSGTSIRSWLSLGDAASAVATVLEYGEPGMVYHAGGNTFASVADVVRTLTALIRPEVADWTQACRWGVERPGIDVRYALDDSNLRALGWTPTGDFWADLPSVVEMEKTSPTW